MNWGNKLLVTFLVFGAGMGYLIYRSLNTRYELVEKDYYKTELRYQQVIDASAHASGFATAVTLEQTPEGILLQLPAEMKNRELHGDIWFYCAYDEQRDKKMALQTGPGAFQLIPLTAVKPGNYTVKINWSDAGKKYYAEKNLHVL